MVLQALVAVVLDQGKEIKQVIRRDSSYVMLNVDGRVVFRDMCALVAPGMSLDSFLTSQGFPQSKLKFPFELFTDMKFLEQKVFPPRDDFVVGMGGQELISEDDYARCKTVFDESCKDLWDYLDVYCRCDVDTFPRACVKVLGFWQSHGKRLSLSLSLPLLS